VTRPVRVDIAVFLEKGSEWKVSRNTIEQFVDALVAARIEEEAQQADRRQ